MNDRGVELRQLRYFVTVADESHIGRAAARLFMAQSSLSQSLQQLEAELGVALFHRHPRGVTPTPAGVELLDPVRAILTATDGLSVIARRAATDRQPVLTGWPGQGRATSATAPGPRRC